MLNTLPTRAKPIVGVLMLNTRFPRYKGDVGNPESFDCTVIYRTVENARVANVVSKDEVPADLLDELVAGGEELVEKGASLIVTSCGFLFSVQEALVARLSVPVVTSALLMLPWLQTLHGNHSPIGILTFDSDALDPSLLEGSGTGQIVIEGMQTSAHFYSVIAEDKTEADRMAMEDDAVSAATRLAAVQPCAVILECTNLAPYRTAMFDVLRVPIIDIVDAARWWIPMLTRK